MKTDPERKMAIERLARGKIFAKILSGEFRTYGKKNDLNSKGCVSLNDG